MLKNITIGQYFPGNSVLHRMDPRTKILMTIAYMIILFAASNKVGLLVGIFAVIIGYGVSKVSPKVILRSLKPIVPLVLFTSVLNIFIIEGEPLISFWKLSISKEGVIFSLVMSIRIICLISGTSLLTYTTTPIALTDGIEQLLSPLKKINFPVHELTMIMTIALRFIPTLIDETDKIMNAQKARGADIDNGGIMQRIKALIPILIPLFVSSFRRADELALAMECRCYRGGEGRTKMKQLHYTKSDLLGAIFIVFCLAMVISINIFLDFRI